MGKEGGREGGRCCVSPAVKKAGKVKTSDVTHVPDRMVLAGKQKKLARTEGGEFANLTSRGSHPIAIGWCMSD